MEFKIIKEADFNWLCIMAKLQIEREVDEIQVLRMQRLVKIKGDVKKYNG